MTADQVTVWVTFILPKLSCVVLFCPVRASRPGDTYRPGRVRMVQDAAYCLAKVGVAGSNPVVRSKDSQVKRGDESAATSTNVRYWSAIAATSAASSSPASVRGSVRVGTHSDNELGVLLSALEPLGRPPPRSDPRPGRP